MKYSFSKVNVDSEYEVRGGIERDGETVNIEVDESVIIPIASKYIVKDYFGNDTSLSNNVEELLGDLTNINCVCNWYEDEIVEELDRLGYFD